MLEIKKTENLKEVYETYRSSFPEDELMDFNDLLNQDMDGELFSIYKDSIYAGFLSIFTYNHLCHILYFALLETYQNQGIGTYTLDWLKSYKQNDKICADLEMPVESNNLDQRMKRIHFYQKNGFIKSEVHYTWQNESYQIYSYNGNVSQKEFSEFWYHFNQKKKR